MKTITFSMIGSWTMVISSTDSTIDGDGIWFGCQVDKKNMAQIFIGCISITWLYTLKIKLKILTFLMDGSCSMVVFSIDCLFLIFFPNLSQHFAFSKKLLNHFFPLPHSFVLKPLTIGVDALSNVWWSYQDLWSCYS